MATQAQVRATWTPEVISNLFWTVAISIGTVILMSFLWAFGAGFTVVFLQYVARAFGAVDEGNKLWYALPVIFSAVEIAGWQVKGRLAPRIQRLATYVTWIDGASTSWGIFLACTMTYMGMLNVLFTQARLPIVLEGLWPSIGAAGLAILAGWWVTLSPERYVLEALKQLWEVGRFLYLAVKG